MRTVPRNQSPKIVFFQTHLPQWEANAAAIGVTPEDVALLTVKTEAASAAMMAQLQAQAAAEAATLALQMAIDDMATQGANMIMQIRTKAAISGGQVYQLAHIPTPAAGSPIGKPGTPTGFRFTLDSRGALQLKWQCKNPRGSTGTMYQVYRQVDGSGAFAFLGVSGTKSFVDATLPRGASMIVYQIRAMRTTSIGGSAEFIVNIGMVRGGAMMTSVQQIEKKAA
ncbi:MAG TPA: hypothetical protein VHS31_00325 [Tepidisphaeraceae bacterium]|jgi:hypothetical protein|nr:hypothetical protein [Tepidisphaeraceae bacterium]